MQYREVALAELQDVLWQRVADKIKAAHDVDVDPLILKHRFAALKKSGFSVGKEIEDDNANSGATASGEMPALPAVIEDQQVDADEVMDTELGEEEASEQEQEQEPESEQEQERQSQTGVRESMTRLVEYGDSDSD
jgi:hypothetical protein